MKTYQQRYGETNIDGSFEEQYGFLHIDRDQFIFKNSEVIEGKEGGQFLQLFHVIHQFNIHAFS